MLILFHLFKIVPSSIRVDLPFIHKLAHLEACLCIVHGPDEAYRLAVLSTSSKHDIVYVLCAAHIIDISWVLENGVTRNPEASQFIIYSQS